MVKKFILAILGISFALFVSSCEEKTKTKKKVCENEQINSALYVPVERERHHSKW